MPRILFLGMPRILFLRAFQCCFFLFLLFLRSSCLLSGFPLPFLFFSQNLFLCQCIFFCFPLFFFRLPAQSFLLFPFQLFPFPYFLLSFVLLFLLCLFQSLFGQRCCKLCRIVIERTTFQVF